MDQLLQKSCCNIGIVNEREEFKNEKILSNVCNRSVIIRSILSQADAASLNKEVKVESNPQVIQVIKGDQIQAFAYKLVNNSLQNGKIDLNQIEALLNNALNGIDASNIIKSLKVTEKAPTTQAPQKETTNKTVEKEVTTPQAPAKQPTAPAKQPTAPVTNNNNTKAPTNNQQVEAPVKQTPTTNVNQSISDFEKQVVDLTNAERAKAGLKPLEIHTQLMNVAQAKSDDMAKNNYFSHNSPTYGSPFDQMKSAGISYRAAGENIAKGQTTPAQVVQAWMDSPGHRANILNANFTHIGVGYVANGNIWTQQFIGL
ncbi:putative YkwD family protein OS=Ureibacillus acetophenoni OX=614649 GN=SAMN05877842_11787 PE=4 SV=1 [Ureibacillus acetophenoni]